MGWFSPYHFLKKCGLGKMEDVFSHPLSNRSVKGENQIAVVVIKRICDGFPIPFLLKKWGIQDIFSYPLSNRSLKGEI